ncbi:MAG: energy-coupling factor transporter transmembrane protein EcfT [Clostridia bacterium]|nr:energy-coupling factor transporter transmembrane protein EcfT [Clostridia bacterium]
MKFFELHPLSLILFFVSAIAFTMITMNPVLLLLSFLCGFLANAFISKGRDLWIYLFLIAIIGITNPVFSHNGETVLFYLFDQRFTLEALVYGFMSGIRIVSVIYWFRLFGVVFKQDKLNWILGKVSPKLSVVFSMALRFIPLVKKNAKDIYNAQISMCSFKKDTLSGKFQLVFNVFSALVSMSIENAIDTADTMRSRGFENKNRTAYSLFSFRVKDIIFMAITIIDDILITYFLFSGIASFYYYPSMYFSGNDNKALVLYAAFAMLCALPMINDFTEDLRWKYSISKI